MRQSNSRMLTALVLLRRYQSVTAKSILDTILSIQPKDSSGSAGETREATIYRLADDMLEKLPSNYIPFEVKAKLQKTGLFQPMNIFLQQEINRMQRVISTVRTTLNDLKLAIDGTIIMSENLRDALDSMYDAKIPQVWQKVRVTVLHFSSGCGFVCFIRVSWPLILLVSCFRCLFST